MSENMSRRTFVEAGATLAAAATIGGNIALAAGTAYAAGTYGATATGMDKMTVTVEIGDDGSIAEVFVDQNETPTVGALFIDQLATQAKEQGDVEIISGATCTSRAFRDAFRNCLAQAAGAAGPLEADDNISPIAPVDAPEVWNMEADVLIVGSSCGGLLCAAKLAEGGKSVIVLEKDSFAGGSGNAATMFHYFGGNEQLWPSDSGYFGTPYSDRDVIEYFMERNQWTVDREYIAHQAVCCREAVDFYLAHGYDIRSTADTIAGQSATFADNSARDNWWFQPPEPAEGFSGWNSALIQWLHETCDEAGVRFEFCTPATALVMEDGRVTGAQAQDQDGNVVYARGIEAVVLAADGAQANHELMTRYGLMGKNVKVAITLGTGKVMRMGIGCGAEVRGQGSMCGTDSLMVPANWDRGELLPRVKYLDAMNWYVHMPWMQIDDQGRRIAWETNGELGRQLVKVGDYLECYHRNMAQEMLHDNCYVVFDKNFREVAASWVGVADTGGHALLPYAEPNTYWVQTDEEISMQEHLADGSLVVADTLEEVAAGIGIAPEALVAAVETWNAHCDEGVDDPMIGYDPAWLVKIAEPPFYGAKVSPAPYATNFGLRVTPKNEVIAEGGAVIPGLYAASHVAGGEAGFGSPYCGMGDQIGAMYESGMNIAKAILGEEWVLI